MIWRKCSSWSAQGHQVREPLRESGYILTERQQEWRRQQGGSLCARETVDIPSGLELTKVPKIRGFVQVCRSPEISMMQSLKSQFSLKACLINLAETGGSSPLNLQLRSHLLCKPSQMPSVSSLRALCSDHHWGTGQLCYCHLPGSP